MSLKQIAVGDAVFVVHQQRRNESGDPRNEYANVIRVGKKYGYILRYGQEAPFSLETGASHHKESNCRANGMGFDVYENETAYQNVVYAARRKQKLKERLTTWSGLIDMSPVLVERLHAVLDEFAKEST